MLACLALLVITLDSASVDSLAVADSLFAQLEYEAALMQYDSLLARRSEDPEVLWRLARLYVAMGDITPREEREPIYRKAERYARRTIEVDSLRSEGHTWLAAALGNLAMVVSTEERVKLAREIERELKTAVRLNPADDVAYSILGSFYRALGNVSWIERALANIFLGGIPPGGYEEAEEAIRRAIEIAPTVLRHQFELGLLYLDWGKDEEARSALEHALTLPVLVASDGPTKERIRLMLASME
jgi:tetratricopeptide (TPR) repeat protein